MSDITRDNTNYYYSNGQRIPLVRDPEAYSVRFRGGEKSDSTSLSLEARALLRRNSEHLGFVPNHNLQVYRLVQPQAEGPGPASPASTGPAGSPGPPPRSGGARDAMGRPPASVPTTPATPYVGRISNLFARLEAEPVIEFAAPVFKRGPAGDLMLVTRQFVAQFKPDVTRAKVDEYNARYGVHIVSPLDYARNGYLLEAPAADGATGPVALANLYHESGLTEFAHPDLITKRVPGAPLLRPSVPTRRRRIRPGSRERANRATCTRASNGISPARTSSTHGRSPAAAPTSRCASSTTALMWATRSSRARWRRSSTSSTTRPTRVRRARRTTMAPRAPAWPRQPASRRSGPRRTAA